MTRKSISKEGLVQVPQALYNNLALLANRMGAFFHSTVGVHQGWAQPLVSYNIFLVNITREAHHNVNIRFATKYKLYEPFVHSADADLQMLKVDTSYRY